MDMLIILGATAIGFVLFITTIYVLARMMFPRLEDKEENYYSRKRQKSSPRPGGHNPYSFMKSKD
jgi:hypothetical protein